jgi:predicted Rossmann fold flavoprotein
MNIAVIGAGAAGFMAAITSKENNPNATVTIFEKSSKILSKVLVSGGGRCNVTHKSDSVSSLLKNYPRGKKKLKKPFHIFSNIDTIKWFEKRNVKLKTETDNRMFPESNTSKTIYECLVQNSKELGVNLKCSSKLENIFVDALNNIEIIINGEKIICDKLIIAMGGLSNENSFKIFKSIGYSIIPPVPSLFTFKVNNKNINTLMGVSVKNVTSSILGTKFKQSGDILITHWGFSGPSILKLSAFAARLLSQMKYDFTVKINWISKNEEITRNDLKLFFNSNSMITNNIPFNIPKRLWEYLLNKNNICLQTVWSSLKIKQINKLVNCIVNDEYKVLGKTTFKEEFVTCGGIDLEDINMSEMQSKLHKNIYFAGEILNIDAITGGFNFQAAWTTGYIAGTN